MEKPGICHWCGDYYANCEGSCIYGGEEESPEHSCLFGDECCMSYCFHFEDECHTAEMMDELYKEMEQVEKSYQ